MKDEALSHLIREKASRHAASARLRADIRTRIAMRTVSSADHDHFEPSPSRLDRRLSNAFWRRSFVSTMPPWKGWGMALAGFGLGAAVVLLSIHLRVGPDLGQSQPALSAASAPLNAAATMDALRADLVANHIHSIRRGPLIQVASNDHHIVKPWFQGKLDYAPPVIALADRGFALLGGRVEQIKGEAVATLVYEHHKHIINVFVWPSNSRQSIELSQVKGFNLAHWSNGSMQCWVVTDMDPAELRHFGAAWHDAMQAT